ncbi:MAG: hypothetical protein AAFZ63_18510 [Bacteroidota bacterium]
MDHTFATQYIDNYLNALRTIKVSEESIKALKKSSKIIQVKSKQTIINPGEICKHAYLIVKGGFVCRYIHETTGVANTINFYLDDLHPIMACVDSYFNQRPTNCELRAIKDSVGVAISRSLMHSLFPNDIYFTKFYYQVITTAIFEENEVKTKLIAYSSKEKYDYILKEMPSVVRNAPSKYIAEFCGISAAWLSKLKK